ncbi:hypothetical protein [Enterococcus ureilyticus]|nr:hypothetical protein [Enterococcus ureilyticus]MBM7687974.1 hypothetical protein [Enterococcus ureilyticus]
MKRKKKSKLLAYYLNLAELGDQQAAKKAELLAKTIFQEKKKTK